MGEKLGDLFSERPLPASPPPLDAPAPPRPGSVWRWVIPVALFVLIVGAIAWISQNLPKRGGPRAAATPTVPAESTLPPGLKFLRTRAVWDPKDPDFYKEFEPDVEGHYDFPFLNPSEQTVTLGFARTSCDCSKLRVAVVGPAEAARLADGLDKDPYPVDPKWTWVELPQNDVTGVDIPPRAGGVVQIYWKSRKSPGSALRLNIRLWMQPTGRAADRSFESLEVPVIIAYPIRFLPDKVAFGPVGGGGLVQEDVIAYSSTRDKLPFKAEKSDLDPLFQVTVVGPLSPTEMSELSEKLRAAKNNTKVTAAVRFRIRLQEQAGGRQLDQGPFAREMPIEMEDGTAISPPQVTATLKGDVEIGVPEDVGRVSFRPFASRDGGHKSVPLWSDGSKLTIESKVPEFLEVKLREMPKDSVPGRTKWMLDVHVPPGSLVGALPEDSVIILKSTGGNRKVRIPVVATAGQG